MSESLLKLWLSTAGWCDRRRVLLTALDRESGAAGITEALALSVFGIIVIMALVAPARDLGIDVIDWVRDQLGIGSSA